MQDCRTTSIRTKVKLKELSMLALAWDFFYGSTLLKRIQVPRTTVLFQTFELPFGPTLRIAVFTYSFARCVSFYSLTANGMGEKAEAAIKAAWAPRDLRQLGM
jgi:hypothetical protein